MKMFLRMIFLKIKAVIDGISFDEQLMLEKKRLIEKREKLQVELDRLNNAAPSNFLTHARDQFGFGVLIMSGIYYSIIASLAAADFLIFRSTNGLFGLLLSQMCVLSFGLLLRIKYPVTKNYFLGKNS